MQSENGTKDIAKQNIKISPLNTFLMKPTVNATFWLSNILSCWTVLPVSLLECLISVEPRGWEWRADHLPSLPGGQQGWVWSPDAWTEAQQHDTWPVLPGRNLRTNHGPADQCRRHGHCVLAPPAREKSKYWPEVWSWLLPGWTFRTEQGTEGNQDKEFWLCVLICPL